MKKSQKLEKLLVQCFVHPDRSGRPADTFEVLFNPESYTHRYLNAIQQRQGIGTIGIREAYAFARPEELSFTLVFDNSIETEQEKQSRVFADVQNFLKATYHAVGEIHAPHFVRLIWGELKFNCRLHLAEVTYQNFDPTGFPFRAELKAQFIGESEDPTGSKSFNSPDLTHLRTVSAGDSLPLITERIYGSKGPMVAIARANQLDSLRKFAPGQQLHFPPLQT